MNPHDLDHTILQHINEKAVALEKRLDCDVIGYFGPIRPGQFRRFRNFVEELRAKSPRRNRTLSVVLRTYGGQAETVERFVEVIRKHYRIVNFIVPDVAYSAGTIFCMSGDRIYMDYSSCLGPIDPQVTVPDASAYVPALGYLDKVEEITNKKILSPADVVFLRGLDLAKLALYEQARDLQIDLLKRWLVKYKFKGWKVHRTTNPGTPVTRAEKVKRAEEVASALSNHKLWRSHGRALTIEKLKTIRLEIDDYSSDQELGDAIRSYHDPLSAYMERMEFPWLLHNHRLEIL